MSNYFNINDSGIVAYTNKLEKMHRSDLPLAVRGALNEAAFQTKTKFIPQEFDENFEERKKNFLRSHSAFNRSANTFDIHKMSSEAGVIQGKSNAGDNLEKQEFGGTINNRDYIPMDPARSGKSNKKLVSKRFYLKNIKPQKGKKRTESQEFIKAAIMAGKGGFVRYDDYLFSIRTIRKPNRESIFIKADPVYSFKQGRSVSITKKPFIKPAGEKAAELIPQYFLEQANRRINK